MFEAGGGWGFEVAWVPTAEDEAFIASLEAAFPGEEEPGEPDEAAGTGDPFAVFRAPEASVLEAHPTGPELAFTLAEADPAAVDDFALVELLTAWTRLTSWAHAGAAQAAAELATRASQIVPEQPPPQPAGRPRRARARSVAAHEIAMRLCISRQAAQSMIENGRAMRGALTPVGQALSAGQIDLPRARAFVTALALAPLEVALAVQEQVLPRAPRRTTRQVAADIARALITTDPHEADHRHHHARTQRKVCRPTPLPDGMAGTWCVLPAADALALDLALDAAARSCRAAADPRSTDQLRADLLASIGHHALTTGWFGPPPAQEPPPAQAPPTRLAHTGGQAPQIRVTIPLAILLPDPDGGDGENRQPPPDPHASDPARPAPAPGAETNHRPRRPTPPRDAPAAQQDHAPPPVHDPDTVFDPLANAVDRDCVAELDGYGPITPAVARALALGGTWRRLILDPRSGTVRDVGRERYRPPTDLADLIRTRDRTCTRPSCGASARGCDLDHTLPYHLGGPTAEHNLAALCPTDHTMKTAGAFRVRQITPGIFEYDLPSGHTYRREPDGTSTLIRRPPQPASQNNSPGNRPDLGPPPF